MNDDIFIRNVLLGIYIVFLPAGLLFRIRSVTDETLDRWQEGWMILFGLRIAAVPVFLGVALWSINPHWMAWSSMPIPLWIRLTSIALVVCAAALVLWTFYNLGRNLTDTVVTRRAHTMVRTGPYRYVRHPFYVAIALGAWSGSIATANWFLFAASFIPLGILYARTSIEERKLIERFGDEYREYMRQVGRFFPRLRRMKKGQAVSH